MSATPLAMPVLATTVMMSCHTPSGPVSLRELTASASFSAASCEGRARRTASAVSLGSQAWRHADNAQHTQNGSAARGARTQPAAFIFARKGSSRYGERGPRGVLGPTFGPGSTFRTGHRRNWITVESARLFRQTDRQTDRRPRSGLY